MEQESKIKPENKTEAQEEEKRQLGELADQLDELQKDKNNGRGVGCVRGVIAYLRYGQLDRAKAAALHDSDKIRNYPDIKEFIMKELFRGENHPWQIEEDLKAGKPL